VNSGEARLHLYSKGRTHSIRVLATLKRVRPKGGAGWTSRCPAHDDGTSSLSIDARDGRVLLKCFAGCTVSAIVEAIGLKEADHLQAKSVIDGRARTRHTHTPSVIGASPFMALHWPRSAPWVRRD
jgi:hypothetical protein